MNSPYLRPVRSATVAAFAAALLAACGGGGGGGGGGQPPPQSVTISGRITFDRIPFDATFDNGLDPGATAEQPARGVTVQALDASSNAVLATATTDGSGNYSVTVPSNRSLFIRARAEMIKTDAAPTWSFSVRNNTNSDALYAVDGNPASSGTTNSTRDLNAPSGFGTTTYTGDRAAAPFAILDTVFKAKELVLTATPNADFPALSLFWSEDNRPTAGRFCPDDGDIGTSSYIVFTANEPDNCTPPRTNNLDGIYILGDFGGGVGDTDEFDESVIAHEFGHYIEDRFGRSDSIGGEHSGSESLLDLRVAFGEGWGNAFSSMARGDPIYRDSFQGVQTDFQIDMETDDQQNEGWFSEASVEEILWDLFDSTNEPGDGITLGFAPIYAVMTGAQTTTDAVTSIFSFITGLRAANPGSAAAIDTLVNGEDIHGTGDFGAGETNDGDPGVDNKVLPIYKPIDTTGPVPVCSRSPALAGNTSSNKLGNRAFLRFEVAAPRAVTIQATGAATENGSVAATDPDIFVLRQGTLAAFGVSSVPGMETIAQTLLPAGIYIIEVYDFEVDGAGPAPRCMTVSITG